MYDIQPTAAADAVQRKEVLRTKAGLVYKRMKGDR